VIGFHPLDEEIRKRPWNSYKWLHEHAPVYQLPAESNTYVLSRYADIRTVLMNPSVYSSQIAPETKLPLLIGLDRPDHTRLRKVLQAVFTPKAIATLTPRIQAIVDEATEDMLQQSHCDLMTAWAGAIPIRVIGEILGCPTHRRGDLRHWSDVFIRFFLPTGGTGQKDTSRVSTSRLPLLLPAIRLFLQLGWRTSQELMMLFRQRSKGTRAVGMSQQQRDMLIDMLNFLRFMHQIIQEHRRHPQDQVIDLLITAQKESGVSEIELLFSCIFLMIAGHETTGNLLASGVKRMADDPALLVDLREKPEEIEPFIEEVLRYDAPLQRLVRRTTQAVELGGLSIPKNAQILLLIGAANHDERVFTDAYDFTLQREINKHLAFGTGIHVCLGAPLARLEGHIAIQAFVRKVGAVHLASEHSIERITDYGAGLYGYKRLSVEVSRREEKEA
jgi:cytochrome P450